MTNNRDFTPNLPLWSFQVHSDSKLALKSRKDLEIYLITRALKDEVFKQDLIANPKAVIEQELGTKLPENLKINVLEESEDTIYIVLPCNPYDGIHEDELQTSLGMNYEDVAQWVLEQQRNTLLDNQSSIKVLAQFWKDEDFRQTLKIKPILAVEKLLDKQIQLSHNVELLLEDYDTAYIVLPKLVSSFEELSLDHLNVDMATALIIGSGCACTVQTNEGNSNCK